MYGMAARNYEQFSERHAGDARADEALYKAAFIYCYYLQEHARAIELFLRLPVLYPKSDYRLRTHKHLAEIFASRLRSYPQAIAQYDQVIELGEGRDGDLSGVYMSKGRCQFMLEDWDNAIATFREGMTAYPSGAQADKAAYQVGYLYFLTGRYEEAEKAFRHFLEAYPESEWTFDGLLHLARTKEQMHGSDESAELYRRLREQFPGRQHE